MAFFTEIGKKNPKIIIELQKLQIVQTILRKNHKAGSITLTDFKLYYKATLIKKYGTGTKQAYRTMDQH